MMNKECGHPIGTHCGCEEGEVLGSKSPPTDVEEIEKVHAEAKEDEPTTEESAPAEPAQEEKDTAPAESEEESTEETDVLQGFFVELSDKGEVRRKFYGKQQNITYMLGLASFIQMEIEQRQRLQRGFLPSAELTATAGLARTMSNIGNVLIQIQGILLPMKNMIQALPDEFRKIAGVESSMDAESESE